MHERDRDADHQLVTTIAVEVAEAIGAAEESFKTGVAPNVDGRVDEELGSRAFAAARRLTQDHPGDTENVALMLELAERSSGAGGARA